MYSCIFQQSIAFLLFLFTIAYTLYIFTIIIEEIVKRGRQAIMLIPEISLTYQTLMRFYRHFGDRVSVMNSTLSESEKSDQFERARRGEIDVIIGPRSALFTPFPRIGAIIMDEEHESSYKNESMPKYHTREVAEKIASMQNGVVVLGSATPSLESYYQAKEGKYRLYELSRRLTGGTLPSVEITDLREELRAGNHSILSRRLSEHALFKPERLFRVCFLQKLRLCAEMPALQRLSFSPPGRKAALPLLRI